MPTPSEMLPRFIRRRQVEERTGLGRSSIYAKILLNEFPRPISLGARAVAWLESDIDEWIRSRVKMSRNEANTKSTEAAR